MHFFGKIGHFHPFFRLETSTSDTFHLRLLILWQIWCQIFFAPPSSCKNLENTCFQPFLAHFWVVKRPLYDFWPKIQQTRQKLVSYYLNDINSKIGYLKKAQNMAFSCVFWAKQALSTQISAEHSQNSSPKASNGQRFPCPALLSPYSPGADIMCLYGRCPDCEESWQLIFLDVF